MRPRPVIGLCLSTKRPPFGRDEAALRDTDPCRPPVIQLRLHLGGTRASYSALLRYDLQKVREININ